MSCKKVSITKNDWDNKIYFTNHWWCECKMKCNPDMNYKRIHIEHKDFVFCQNTYPWDPTENNYYCLILRAKVDMTFSDFCHKHKNFVKKFNIGNILIKSLKKSKKRKI